MKIAAAAGIFPFSRHLVGAEGGHGKRRAERASHLVRAGNFIDVELDSAAFVGPAHDGGHRRHFAGKPSLRIAPA